MSERYFSLPAGGAHALTNAVIDALLKTGSGDVARVYLYLLRAGGACAEEAMCATLELELAAALGALTQLKRAGLLEETDQPRLPGDIRPDYSSGEVAHYKENNAAFRHVVDETQRRLGRVLSSSDLQILLGLYDWRGFSPGVISLLVSYCLEDAARRYGPDRPPTLRQIDKQAARWEQENIDTEERAEQYIQARESARQAASAVYRMLGIQNRTPSPTEKRFVADWLAAGFDVDAIALAYDKTATTTGGLNWKYMNGILKKWQEKEMFTRKAVETGDVRTGQASGGKPAVADRAASQKRDKLAMERMKEYLKHE